jgi:hypothetical protein
MNTIAKILASATLAVAAFSAQAEDLTYPGPIVKSTMSTVAANQESPYVFQGEALLENPKFMSAKSATAAEVRKDIMKARRVLDASTIGA